MGIKDWNAGIIRPVPVAPNGPYGDGSAPGVWTLDQVAYWSKQGLWPIAGNFLLRGLIAGGISPSSNVIEYISIPTLGNATDFGDLTLTVYDPSSMSNATRAVFAGGAESNNVMSYVSFATTGNASDFGDLTGNRRQMSQGSVNSTTRGIVAGGWTGAFITGEIQYITIATTGNATNFGNLTNSITHGYWPGSFSSSTRGVFGGGETSGVIDYVTIATTGNAVNFGSLTVVRDGLSGCSNSTRGLFAQGYVGAPSGVISNVIDYVTIATTGNAIDFGDCSTGARGSSSMSSSTRAVINVGTTSYPYASNVMEYVTIASTGNTTDFGDLIVSLGERTACSNCNGGTQ